MKKFLCIFATFGFLFAGSVHAAPCLNVDKATAKEIAKNLAGVGPAKAKAIVDHRKAKRAAATKAGKAKWNFKNWKTLLDVPGIGDKICADNVGKVCFADKTVAQKACPKAKKKAKK